MAASNYESAEGCLPPGVLGQFCPFVRWVRKSIQGRDNYQMPDINDEWRRQDVGVLVYLFPHLGQQHVFEDIDAKVKLHDWRKIYPWYVYPEVHQVGKQTLSCFLCPSDTPSRELSSLIGVFTFAGPDGEPHMHSGFLLARAGMHRPLSRQQRLPLATDSTFAHSWLDNARFTGSDLIGAGFL